MVEPRVEPDWTSRNWESEVRAVSAVLKNYPELYNSRVTYHLIYATTYLVTTEGTQIRASRTFAAIEASLGAQADDGMPVHNYLAIYANRPGELPAADAVRQQLDAKGKELAVLRLAPPVQDYDGPVLFEAPAAGSLLAQFLGAVAERGAAAAVDEHAIRADDAGAGRAERMDGADRTAGPAVNSGVGGRSDRAEISKGTS